MSEEWGICTCDFFLKGYILFYSKDEQEEDGRFDHRLETWSQFGFWVHEISTDSGRI